VARSMLTLFAAFLLLGLVPWAAAGQDPPKPETPSAVEMPDQSHRLLAEHAAQSHGLDTALVDWIGTGAYDEDHCVWNPYPPCIPFVPNGWHSWDPDTGEWWTDPVIWPDFGSGLVHADRLFLKALNEEAAGDTEAAYRTLGRAIHMLGDMATPAHVHLDTHLPPFDMDPYEGWLGEDDRANTRAWISVHPAAPAWDLAFYDLPAWSELGADLQGQLDAASQAYGGRSSGQALWQLGPEGIDAVVFRLMFLMAEEADNWDSDDVAGEQYPGDLDDAAYLAQMRDSLFPLLVPYSAALIDYFEWRAGSCPECTVFLPLVQRGDRSATP
jgi:hypothetical protein